MPPSIPLSYISYPLNLSPWMHLHCHHWQVSACEYPKPLHYTYRNTTEHMRQHVRRRHTCQSWPYHVCWTHRLLLQRSTWGQGPAGIPACVLQQHACLLGLRDLKITNAFVEYLSAGSTADFWYHHLLQATRNSWNKLETAFIQQWPAEENEVVNEVYTMAKTPVPFDWATNVDETVSAVTVAPVDETPYRLYT